MNTINQHQHILLIDDNDVDNYLTERVITKTGFANKIDICNSGQEALDYIRRRVNNINALPDVIFLDLNMPIVDGFIFLFEWENFPIEVKEKCSVIVLSSMLDQVVIDKVSKNPFVNQFIPKPLSASALKRIEKQKTKFAH